MTDGEGGYPPIPSVIDEALSHIALAPLLNVPADRVPFVDRIHIHAALIRYRAQQIADEEARKK